MGIGLGPQASGGGAEQSAGGEVERLGKQPEPGSVEGLLRGGSVEGQVERGLSSLSWMLVAVMTVANS